MQAQRVHMRAWQRRPQTIRCLLSARTRTASPLVLRVPVSAGQLLVSIDGAPQTRRPGNGGLRIWKYHSEEDAVAEARILASGMTKKHEVFCTGFSGAKLVLNTPDPSAVDKQRLMSEVAEVLHELEGAVFTGCDVNTSQEDMELLTDLCPYVLASVGCPTDANEATGHGVYAAIKAWLDADMGGAAGARVLVKGCGKVGSTVARLLVAAGAVVLTLDTVPSRADIPGTTNVSAQEWWKIPCDVFAPCSTSRFISEDIAERIPCRAVVGSSNAPFASPQALAVLEARGLTFVPEAISSAGAVLADSIECFDAEAYRSARPAAAYAFIRHLVCTKTKQLLAAATARGVPASHCLPDVTPDNSVTAPVGANFSAWLSSNTVEYDVVVVGAGMAGTSTAYQLSRCAPHLKGLLLESRAIAHPGGSSHGDSRMYRQMYSDPYYATMQAQALQMWRELEQDAGVTLLKEQGLLFYGDTDTGETVEGSVKGAADTMQQLGIPHTYYGTADQLQQRWPHLVPQPQYEGVHEATAGRVNASLACKTMAELAVASGWQLQEGLAVEDIVVVGPQHIELITSSGQVVVTKKLVLCAGAWTNQLLQLLGCEMDLEIHSVAWGHWEVTPEAAQQLPQWFCFNKTAAGLAPDGAAQSHANTTSSTTATTQSAQDDAAAWDGGLYYAFPPESPDEHKIKVGIDFTPDAPGFKLRHMASFSYQAHPHIAGLMEGFMQDNWAGVGARLDLQASPYTMTRDQDFVLGELPGQPGVLLFTGGSGRAFKFAPLIGRCLADLVVGAAPSFDVSRLSPERPAAGLTTCSPAQPDPPTLPNQSLQPVEGAKPAAKPAVELGAGGARPAPSRR